jgi:hypothetical protein
MPPIPLNTQETYIVDPTTQELTLVPHDALVITLRYPPTPRPTIDFFLQCIPDPARFLTTTHASIRRILDPSNRLPVRYRGITLTFSEEEGLADTQGDVITLSIPWLRSWALRNDVQGAAHEFKGVIAHELVHVVQYDGRGTAAWWFIEGLADYVRLRVGLAPSHWAGRGAGESWEEGYEATAHFFGWLDEQRGARGLLVRVNASLAREEWMDGWFDEGTGLSVGTLWRVYKAQH